MRYTNELCEKSESFYEDSGIEENITKKKKDENKTKNDIKRNSSNDNKQNK